MIFFIVIVSFYSCFVCCYFYCLFCFIVTLFMLFLPHRWGMAKRGNASPTTWTRGVPRRHRLPPAPHPGLRPDQAAAERPAGRRHPGPRPPRARLRPHRRVEAWRGVGGGGRCRGSGKCEDSTTGAGLWRHTSLVIGPWRCVVCGCPISTQAKRTILA